MEVLFKQKIRTIKHYNLTIKYNDLELNYYIETSEFLDCFLVTLIKLQNRTKLKNSDKKKIFNFIINYFDKSL